MDGSSALVLDALLDRLLPADAHGPGAVELGVGRYVRASLADAYVASAPLYASGLRALDAAARTRFGGAGFVSLDAPDQDELIAAIEGTAFFELVRRHAFEGMFGDPSWGGNAGGAGWALLGYDGPRWVVGSEDQR